MLIGGAGGPSGHFEVWVPDLQTGATDLSTDSTDAASATSAGSGGLSAAQDGCGGGPLAGALARAAGLLTTAGGDLTSALAVAGLTLTGNAETYLGYDATAAATFSTWSPGGSLSW